MGLLFKFLVFLIAFLVISFWIRNLLFGRKPQSNNTAPKNQRKVTTKQTITCCKYCGVFVPEKELISGALGCYCSTEHKIQDEQAEARKR